jgi:hypothetical protein
MRIPVPLSSRHYLPQFRTPRGRAALLVLGSFRDRERGDLEGAQYRCPVLATQPSNLGNAGA